MNISPVFKAETASDLREDILKISLSLCIYFPVASMLAALFLRIFSSQSSLKGEALTNAFLQSNLYHIYTLVVSVVPILLSTAALILLTKRRLTVLILKPSVSCKKILAFTLAGCILIPVSAVMSLLSNRILAHFEIELSSQSSVEGPLATMVFIVAHVILAPVLEEFLFRSLILERFRRYGEFFAVLTSALLFSLLHCSFQNYLHSFVCGILLGFLAIYTGSMLCPLIVHLLNNALGAAMILLSDRLTEQQNDFIYLGICGLMFIASLSAILFIQKKSPQSFSLKFNQKILSSGRKAGILFASMPTLFFIIMSLSLAFSAV